LIDPRFRDEGLSSDEVKIGEDWLSEKAGSDWMQGDEHQSTKIYSWVGLK